MAGEGHNSKLTLDAAKQLFAAYIENNPHSAVVEEKPEEGPEITTPWGDESLILKIPPDSAALAEALNNIILPQSFSALWHIDSKELEVIYTAFPLIGSQADMLNRKFTFAFHGKKYRCEFRESSKRLLEIADKAFSVAMSPITEHRNLPSFWHFLAAEKGNKSVEKLDGAKPICFWIKGLTWDEAKTSDLAMHLNFYMTYFDTMAPTINVFPPKEKRDEKPRERYIAGSYPSEMRGRELNLNLVHYWLQARKSDATRRFVYCYQIVEYATFYFIEEDVRRALRRAMATPHISLKLDEVIIEIMDSVAEKKQWDGTKMERFLRETMDEKLLWREIDKNRIYFSTPHEFDGGFKLRTLINEKETQATFCNNWEGAFVKDLRDIRNAISHGKEQSMAGVIAPTAHNIALIAPWAQLATIVAGEAMLYRHS